MASTKRFVGERRGLDFNGQNSHLIIERLIDDDDDF